MKLIFVCLTFVLLCVSAQAQYQRKTPSGEYQDPASQFFLHGYVTSTFASPQSEFGKSPETNGQILLNGVSGVTGDNEGGFQHDFAIFVGSEKVQDFQAIFEIHYVRTALDPVVTEAKVLWTLSESDDSNTTMGFGRQWWAFGIHNRQWFSPINEFNVVSPMATHVLPPHHNEIGVWIEGDGSLSGFGYNYVLSVANGPMSFNLNDNVANNTSGTQKDLTYTGRIGLFPAGETLELGVSFTSGTMRDAASPNSSGGNTDPLNFAADHTAIAVDIQAEPIQGLMIKGQWADSNEDLEGSVKLNRSGFDLDLTYQLPLDQKIGTLWSLSPKLRYSSARIEQIANSSMKIEHLGFGLNYRPTEIALIKVEYVKISEPDSTEVDNDVFNVGVSFAW